jgi:hypothetical protein
LNTKKSRVAINVNEISIAIFVVDFVAPGDLHMRRNSRPSDIKLKLRTRLTVAKTWTTGFFAHLPPASN